MGSLEDLEAQARAKQTADEALALREREELAALTREFISLAQQRGLQPRQFIEQSWIQKRFLSPARQQQRLVATGWLIQLHAFDGHSQSWNCGFYAILDDGSFASGRLSGVHPYNPYPVIRETSPILLSSGTHLEIHSRCHFNFSALQTYCAEYFAGAK